MVQPRNDIFDIECVQLTIFYHQYFLRLSKIQRMLHHYGQVGEFRVKNASLCLLIVKMQNICNLIG